MNMKKIFYILAGLMLPIALLVGCTPEAAAPLDLDGDTWLLELKVSGYEAEIDSKAKTAVISVPETFDDSKMIVESIVVSEGAEASVKEGDVLNLTSPRQITVRNGDAFLNYTVSTLHDKAVIDEFVLNGTYKGTIDQANRTITVRVPSTENVAAMSVNMTYKDGTVSDPENGAVVDFTNPVEFKVTYKTSTSVYKVTVIASDNPAALYVGLATSLEGLGSEEFTAASWMIENVTDAQYASFDDIAAGRVDLSECQVIWWHLHIDGGIDNLDKFDAAAGASLGAVAKLKEYYNNGGHFLLSRFATYYAVKLGATKDGRNPNNCWGGSETAPEVVGGPWDFRINDHADHPLYDGLITNGDMLYMFDAGYGVTNSTCQWHIGTDWGGYADYDTWRNDHGGVDLGYGGDGAIVVWEYPAAEGRGHIVCIGSGCYDWYAHGIDVSADQYHSNVSQMTTNAFNYLKTK